MTKFSSEKKIEAIQLLEEGRAIRAVARALGVSPQVLRNWRYRKESGGYEQLLSTRKYYTAEFKLSAIAYRRENDLSYSQAAADLGISGEGTLYAWEKVYRERGADGLQDTRKGRPPIMPKQEKKSQQALTREQELEAEVAYLKMENAYLKKLKALVEGREKSAKKTK